MRYLQRDIKVGQSNMAPTPVGRQQPASLATPAILQANQKFMFGYNYKDLINNGKSISLRLSDLNNGAHIGRVTFSLDDNNNIFAEVYYGGKTTFHTDLNDLRLLIGLLSSDHLDVKTSANTSTNSGTSLANKIKTFMPDGKNYNIDAVRQAYNGQPIPIIAALNELLSPRNIAVPQQFTEPTQPIIEKPLEQSTSLLQSIENIDRQPIVAQNVTEREPESPSHPQSAAPRTMTRIEAFNRQALESLQKDGGKFIQDLYTAQRNFPDGNSIIPISLREYINSRDTFGELIGEKILDVATLGIRDTVITNRIKEDIARSQLPPNEYYIIREDNSIFQQLDPPVKDLVMVEFFECKVLSRSVFQPIINPSQKPSRPGTVLCTGVTRKSLDTFTAMVNALSEATPKLKEIKNTYLEKIELYEFSFFVENIYDRNPTLENTELFIAKIQELPLKLPNRNIREYQNTNYRRIYNYLLPLLDDEMLTNEVRRIGSQMPDPFGQSFRN
ncbi:MAG: hypothetical protein LBL50_03650 [Candidatus Margulisbacteria bacterium]|jgi:hypothetical protein|nr:hypothetical protein [Candidatus Margulisiibacteriota bacterium]